MHKGWVRNPNHIPQHRNDDSFPLPCVWGSWQWKWWIAPLHLGSFQCLGDPVLMLSFVRTGWQVHTLWPFADSHWAFLWTCIAFFLFFLYWSSPSGIVPSPSCFVFSFSPVSNRIVFLDSAPTGLWTLQRTCRMGLPVGFSLWRSQLLPQLSGIRARWSQLSNFLPIRPEAKKEMWHYLWEFMPPDPRVLLGQSNKTGKCCGCAPFCLCLPNSWLSKK